MSQTDDWRWELGKFFRHREGAFAEALRQYVLCALEKQQGSQ